MLSLLYLMHIKFCSIRQIDYIDVQCIHFAYIFIIKIISTVYDSRCKNIIFKKSGVNIISKTFS